MNFTDKPNFFRQIINQNKRPLVIAGPCSAESELQVLETAKLLKPQVDIFRAGTWKPRSRPNSFEGIGTDALVWLQQVKQETGLPVATEVATPAHAEAALKHNVDVLWIGARTTVNPFAVQEIADALRGTSVPVMVKNPVNPDLALWAGAIERIYKAVSADVAAIHRGFTSFEPSHYRNVPAWQIPIELKQRYKELPLIIDPSHIGGHPDLIFPITQKAMDLDYDGMMIEVHPNPKDALSDADQQITPAALTEILAKLKVRCTSSTDKEFINKAEELRHKIDAADRELIEVLARRMALVQQIGEYKKQNNVTVLQMDRWNEIFRTRPEWAAKMGVNKKFVAELYKLIHIESIRKQTAVIMEEKEKK
ncbi:MAG: bifunctional 3-deoxy-7-phosphoheptulonate synthase/chorismate mutase type II [Hymenobacteraceae bacterium]|nr:bifunctional 3-deoxy-7-phosphoheptulonate synthase/chorismate mutase type II [Hymenobacteraceae bacterium]MDX5396146.1 bifunctional 3-deoxy-7-phosphoheptulonate synthase/chorismate mutase type II [Hymenobacteraceae bacterium]MDX5512207.1 bifunctional 3-deoxy-7-phosphoheptulonate synthase/chorismate mutase type II [Hymenobacteraceae bacterium]